MNESNYNTIMIGILMGAIFPVLSFFVIEQIFAMLVAAELLPEASGMAGARRERTMYLFSVVACIIPLQILNNKHADQAVRGFMIPMAIYLIAWVWRYGRFLLENF